MKSWSLGGSAPIAVAMAVVLASCGQAESVDKAGGETVVLHMATIDNVNPNGQYFGSETFVTALEDVSNGRLKVELSTNYGEGAPDAESQLVEAIATGRVDGGAPSTRAFNRAGITGLEAIEAPMTITSYAAQKALVSGPIADELLRRLEGSGVVGLGLSVGPLRRPFASEAPLLGPEDWEGIRFRVFNSPIQADAVQALGGEPVNMGFDWLDEVEAGNLRGAEFDVAQYWTNGLTTEAGNVTANVVLWPKVIVLAFSQERWDALSDDQRGWIRAAADQAVQASIAATYDEAAPARDLCDEGVRFIDASGDQIVALRETFAPILTELGQDPLMADILALAAQHPEADVPDVPVECREKDEQTAPDSVNTVPEEASSLPDGLYRVDITVADLEAIGRTNANGWTGTWTLEIGDGTYALRCHPIDDPGRDCGNIVYDEDLTFDTVLDAGFVRGVGDTAFFVYDAGLHSEMTGCEIPCFPLPTYRLTWKLEGDLLTFSELQGVVATEKEIKPWRKIG